MNTLTRKGILSLACILAFIMPSAAFWRDEVQALAEESLLSSSVGHAPVVQTVETETVKDVMVHIPLAATDPDGDTVTLKLIDQPRLGTAAFENENLIYTPAAGKTGTDQFSYCAVDVMGNESEPARISVKIEKNSSGITYADMTYNPNHLAAVRLAQEEIFLGEKVGSAYFLHPTQTVTRNEFIAIAAAAADLELEDTTVTDFQDDSALSPWVKPYISAAAEAGLIQGYQTASGNAEIRGERAITISEAAVIVSNLMTQQQIPTAAPTSGTISYRVVPAWAESAVSTLDAADILPTSELDSAEPLTRETACVMLYRVLCLADEN